MTKAMQLLLRLLSLMSFSVMMCFATEDVVHRVLDEELRLDERALKGKVINVDIDTNNTAYKVGPNFLSIGMSVEIMTQLDKQRNKLHFDVMSEKLRQLAKGLGPCSARLASNFANFLIFSPKGRDPKKLVKPTNIRIWEELFKTDFWNGAVGRNKNLKNFVVTGDQLYSVLKFCKDVNWEPMLNLNALLRHGNNTWDPANAKLLLRYVQKKGLYINAFQLSLEPNSYPSKYGFEISPEKDARDHRILRKLLNSRKYFKNSRIIGPDTNSLVRRPSARRYLVRFLSSGGAEGIDDLGLHHYFLDGKRAKLQDFLEPNIMEQQEQLVVLARRYQKKFAPGNEKPIFISETASAYGGGKRGLSDRVASTFIWLDQLGSAASLGVAQINRMSFFKGGYALISNDYDPYPDYFVSVLHKRLVQGAVFKVSTQGNNGYVHVYANCVNTKVYPYNDGDIVVYYTNHNTHEITLTLTQFSDNDLDMFILTGPPGNMSMSMASDTIYLNGQPLTMNGDFLPDMNPEPGRGHVIVPPLSLGFIVVKNASVKRC